MAKIETKATVEKLVRVAGKGEAQVLITVPAALAATIPLGAVMLSVETLQSALFGKNTTGTKTKK